MRCFRRARHGPVQLVSIELAPPSLQENHTQEFADASYQHNLFRNPSVVLRRGATVRFRVTSVDRAIPSRLGAQMRDLIDVNASILQFPPVDSAGVAHDSRCFTQPAGTGSSLVHFRLPPNMPVGEYSLWVYPDGRSDLGVALHRLLVLFNPWCEHAEEFIPDEKARNEYVRLQTGYLFQGNWHRPFCTGWNYAQFAPGVLSALRRMLFGLRATDRASPVLFSRACTSFCNSPDNNGVLAGNWSNDFRGGVAPMTWRGSLEILSSWTSYGAPVKFGQCWVFAGVLTSVMRCAGLAARPVTNFRSAHDTNANRMIDEYYDVNGRKTDDTEDSVWNFHVWTEVYMARPDLPQDGLGGWQAIDATPQERSAGRFQCGPASVAAVKLGLQMPYDTDFVIAEVNADVRKYLRSPSEAPRLISVDEHDVGRMMLTKALGSWDQRGEDVMHRYKAPEGSMLNRASLLRLESNLASKLLQPGRLVFDIPDASVGATVNVKLSLELNPAATYPPQILMSIEAIAGEYTGRGRTVLGNAHASLTPDAAESDGLKLNLATTGHAFMTLLTGSFCSVLVVGVATWIDHEQKTQMLLVEDSIELQVPGVDLDSVQPAAQVGRESVATFSFTNPFDGRPLTGVKIFAEGTHLMAPQSVQVDTVPPGAKGLASLKFVPRLRYAGSYMLITTVVSNELTGIIGKHLVKVSGPNGIWGGFGFGAISATE